MRLLHREVDLLLQGVDRQGILYGAVLHPKGDVRHELLKQGLARMVDWSLAYVSRGEALAMRQAENEGKRAQRRLWRDWSPPQIDGDADFTGVVVEVHSGDQLTVAVSGNNSGTSGGASRERRLALSSVRAPRVGNPRRSVEDEPWAVESKEALRKLTIGKSVRVKVDYQRDIPQTSGEAPVKRAFATITLAGGDKCLQEMMVETGMAGVARLRQDDPRTEHYDAIMAAEASTKAAKKGMHSEGTRGWEGATCSKSFVPSLRAIVVGQDTYVLIVFRVRKPKKLRPNLIQHITLEKAFKSVRKTRTFPIL